MKACKGNLHTYEWFLLVMTRWNWFKFINIYMKSDDMSEFWQMTFKFLAKPFLGFSFQLQILYTKMENEIKWERQQILEKVGRIQQHSTVDRIDYIQ